MVAFVWDDRIRRRSTPIILRNRLFVDFSSGVVTSGPRELLGVGVGLMKGLKKKEYTKQ